MTMINSIRSPSDGSCSSASRWYSERSLAYVIALTFGLYFLRVTLLPVYGEEPRRAVIAREMLQSGDWIVPRIQGVPHKSRPPLQNWLIAAASVLTGSVDAWAIRLPSLLATLATTVLVYGYSHRRAGEPVAVLSATCYVTLYEVLEYGRLGETEAVFTVFVASSLLLWHWGHCERWNPWFTWPLCYLLAGCGMLTKGLQAPLYFAGGVGIFLLAHRRLREAFTLPHLFGLATLAMSVGAWQLAFICHTGWDAGVEIYSHNIAARFIEPTNDSFLAHLVIFPTEVFAVMLPGSLLLLAAFHRVVRNRLSEQRSTIFFLAASAAWAFIFVWLPPGGRARYYMPLMPLIAVLTGLVGDAWFRLSATPSRRRWALSGLLAAAAFYVGPVLSFQARMCDDVAGQITELKHQLPPGEQLVSFGRMHHVFLYYYGESIRSLPMPVSEDDVPVDVDYFAIHTHNSEPPLLPFAWQEIDVITCDRYRREQPRVRIHIGRKIGKSLDVATSNNQRGQ